MTSWQKYTCSQNWFHFGQEQCEQVKLLYRHDLNRMMAENSIVQQHWACPVQKRYFSLLFVPSATPNKLTGSAQSLRSASEMSPCNGVQRNCRIYPTLNVFFIFVLGYLYIALKHSSCFVLIVTLLEMKENKRLQRFSSRNRILITRSIQAVSVLSIKECIRIGVCLPVCCKIVSVIRSSVTFNIFLLSVSQITGESVCSLVTHSESKCQN